MGIKKAFRAWNAESSDIFMTLDTNLIINNIKNEYLNYMQSLDISEEFKNKLIWNENKHLTIYLISLPITSINGYKNYNSLVFAVKSNKDIFKILSLPEDTEIPYLQERDPENIFDYLVKNKLLDMNIKDKGGIFDITNDIFSFKIDNSENVIRAFKSWSYHFLDVQLALIKDNDPIDLNESTDFQDNQDNSGVNILINKVNDKIFSYQYKEASELFSMGYYLGAGCVFGVALERICVLIAQKNKSKLPDDKTEIGYFAYNLHNEKIISNSYKKRLLGAAKFRNISSHTNAEAVKGDASVLDAVIKDIIHEYL